MAPKPTHGTRETNNLDHVIKKHAHGEMWVGLIAYCLSLVETSDQVINLIC